MTLEFMFELIIGLLLNAPCEVAIIDASVDKDFTLFIQLSGTTLDNF